MKNLFRKVNRLASAALIAVSAWAGFGAVPHASAQPVVVVELFTSQGCYSCPPADEVLGKLAEYDDIVALSMHVDYWDYLGWRDTFAQRGFTERQYSYRNSMGERVVYTPQMIIQGVSPVTGSRGMSVKDAISQVRATPETAVLSIRETGTGLKGTISPQSGAGEATLFMAKYTRSQTVDIARGENGGKTLTYHNVVDMLSPLGTWSGREAREVDLPSPAQGEGIAIWLQKGRTGAILAAAKFER
ncbi:MAG: DUF1223 domain-containing protein [Pseudomonadota bacterium]